MPTALLEARRRAVAEALRAEALRARIEGMSRQLTDVQARLAAVESTLLEATWESPSRAPEEPVEPEERVAVPKLDLDSGEMSRTASQALFGH